MRILLTILVFIFAPVLTEQGLQIGEVNINNQKIKIMKMNLNNPAFLQMAGNVKAEEYISFVDASGSPQIYQLSAIGNVSVVSTYNGVQTTQLLTSPNEETVNVQSDPNTQVFLYGKITKFYCDPGPGTYTDFTTLDVTKARSLTYLDCGNNQLTSLDLSANTALTELYCYSNQLTSLDLSANTALTKLYCNENQLTSLDLSTNTALTNLYCYINQLTSLDLSANTALTELYCNSNQLTSLDLSANTALTKLSCGSNQLTSLNLRANTALTELYCSGNENITTIEAVVVYSGVASAIASLITDATSVDGIVTLRQGDEFNQTIIDAATNKGWDVQYYQ